MIGVDFETYSEAGYSLSAITGRWGKLPNAAKAGIQQVGAAAYSEHPSTTILMIAYNNPADPREVVQWFQGDPPPIDLFEYIRGGGLIRAANSLFEFFIWKNVATARMGWPSLPLNQLRCTLAKSRAYGGPGSLGKASAAYSVEVPKQSDGARLIKKFSCPRNFTKTRTHQQEPIVRGDVDGDKYLKYNVVDVISEKQVDDAIPPPVPFEMGVWAMDQRSNARGVAIDVDGLNMLQTVADRTVTRLTPRVAEITGGEVNGTSEVAAVVRWCAGRGIHLPDLQKDTVTAALDGQFGPPAPDVAELLELRQIMGGAAVKKLPAIRYRLCGDHRVRDLLVYCGAGQTGRWAGRGPQPQNLPNSGPLIDTCESCGAVQSRGFPSCHNCGPSTLKPGGWSFEAAETALTYDADRFADAFSAAPLAAAAGCLRGLFVAAPGHDLICSDYSAIEAVVLAVLAGEQWRIDVFNTHGKIYEMSAAKITGIPFDEFIRHKKETGDHHPMRKKIGKISELASGYGGSVGAWLAFGAGDFMTESEIKENVDKWRDESPSIVNFWYGVERAAVSAVRSQGVPFSYRSVTYIYDGKVLRCELPSGRSLYYHKPFLRDELTPWGAVKPKLYFWGTDPKTGAWGVRDTYGGKLTENITQGVARDIMAPALVRLERAGYPPVLHVHDEIVSEVPHAFGSVEEFERLMATMPDWAHDWPIRAAGGWRGRRYRKD